MDTNGQSIVMPPISEQKRAFKFLFVGDAYCGKTRIIQTYLDKHAPKVTAHTPISTSYRYDLGGLEFSLVDVRGTDDIAKASSCFNSTDVAIFVYAINDPKSLKNLRYQWIPRFRMSSFLEVPTIIVGNKRDLRASQGLRSIAKQQPDSVSFFEGMKGKICCSTDMYLECSAEDYESIYCLFQAAYSYVT